MEADFKDFDVVVQLLRDREATWYSSLLCTVVEEGYKAGSWSGPRKASEIVEHVETAIKQREPIL